MGFSPSAGGTVISVGIGHAPTLFGVRNLKGRNVRPYPIKLGRICTRWGEIRAHYCQLSCHWVETESHTDRDTSHTPALPLGRDVVHTTQPHTTRGQALDDSPNIEWTLNREPLRWPSSGHLLSPQNLLMQTGVGGWGGWRQQFRPRRKLAPGTRR